jgi:hypothetical protein
MLAAGFEGQHLGTALNYLLGDAASRQEFIKAA